MADEKTYDAVIVGSGIAGALVALQLSRAGKTVLVLEAGPGEGLAWRGYQSYVDRFYTAEAKVPNSAYPNLPDAPENSVLDVKKLERGQVDTAGMLIQKGPIEFASSYTRAAGGTTLHWLGSTPRMLPNDFRQKTVYGHGVDWPLDYEELRPWYEAAEREIGVSADVDQQKIHGLTFGDYLYPMHGIPGSYVDAELGRRLDGMTVDWAGGPYPIRVVQTPQARNGMPNAEYEHDGQPYEPVGAVGYNELGQRCAGNASCIPICPIQAKYNALKTLSQTDPNLVKVQVKSVASKVEYDDDGRITGIVYKQYTKGDDPAHTVHTARGRVYVLAANAIETPRLALNSGLRDNSDQLGRNLMDHPVVLTWGTLPTPLGPFRGPGSTSGISALRDGAFRSEHGAFRTEIGNWGWTWPTNAPYSDVTNAVEDGLYGKALVEHLKKSVGAQFRLGFLVEQLPQPDNRVTVDPELTDPLGNPRAVISYDIPEYTRAGMRKARDFGKAVLAHAGGTDRTEIVEDDGNVLDIDGERVRWGGAGHIAGTHRMGSDPKTSVVDPDQRCWQHKNLFMVGCGSMPTLATSNPTLTMAALALRSAEAIVADLA